MYSHSTTICVGCTTTATITDYNPYIYIHTYIYIYIYVYPIYSLLNSYLEFSHEQVHL